jgi:DNA-binding Lrp family transcriptional regulator
MVIFAFVLVSAEPRSIARLGAELADLDGVVEVHSVAGSNVALIAKLAVRDHEQIAEVVTEHITQLEGITDTQTLISFRQYGEKQLTEMYDWE